MKNCDRPRGYGFKHLTLTISNQPHLQNMAAEITKSFRKLRQRQYWKNNVDGGAFVLEITGHPGSWHVHIHAIIMARYMPFDRLLALWRKVSSGRGVYIQQIPPSKVTGYLCKYLTKPDAPDDLLDEMNWELHDRRLFNPFGSWHTLDRKYEPPRHLCPECGNGKFTPFDTLVYGLPPCTFSKDICRSPPKTSKTPI